MSLFPLAFPPGIASNGTEYQNKGRWKDCNLVRFHEGAILPEGGWRVKSTSAITGKGRALLTWETNDGSTFGAVGTESHLYAMGRDGTLYNITPSGFTPGRADAAAGGGYGTGDYSPDGSLYGEPSADDTNVLPASMWSLDTFGQDLVGVMSDDKIIYEWALDTGTPAAAVANAPTATSLFVTTEGMLVALAADDIPRRVKWSDLEDDTLWTAAATNSAGDKDLQTQGTLLQGMPFGTTHLILSTVDLWTMTFTTTDAIYILKKVPGGVGGVSRKCMANVGNASVWMGSNGFYSYNGYVLPMECEVWDKVFNDINRQQISKVTVEVNAAFDEVVWHYPSGSSTEVDRKVTWNYKENHWRVGYVGRLSGCDGGVMQYPLAVAADGYVYEHEVGYNYGGLMPWLESGPFDIEDGNVVQYASQLIPDEATKGQATATFFVKFAPEDDETSFGPYTLSKYTDARFGARQARLRYDGIVNEGWRVGTPRLEVTAGGGR